MFQYQILSSCHPEKNSFSTYLTYIKNTNLDHPFDFFALQIFQKIPTYLMWFLFGTTPGVDSYSRHFGAVNE